MPFTCTALHCRIAVRVCLLRQAVHARQKTRQASRGQGGAFPSCSERCAQGAALREALGATTWRGAGPGGWFREARVSHVRAAQLSARARLEAEGLLDIPPCLDRPPPDQSDPRP